jgi:ABC-type antimicrobial peptide transport system permease subunit
MLSSFLNFDKFIVPTASKVIYWIGLVGIVLGVLVGIFTALSSPYGGGGMGALLAILGGAVAVVVWRIAVETWMVLFAIHDVLKELRDKRAL